MSIKEVRETYQESLAQYGTNPRALGWKSQAEQYARFAVLSELLPRGASLEIGDFGCGFGDLLLYLKDEGLSISRYVGVDVSSEMLDRASERLGFLREPPVTDLEFVERVNHVSPVDWWFASGTWNVRGSTPASEWLGRVEADLEALFRSARVGVTCNFLSDLVDFENEGLFYAPLSRILGFVRTRLSRRFIVRHDYMPFEWTLIILKEASGNYARNPRE